MQVSMLKKLSMQRHQDFLKAAPVTPQSSSMENPKAVSHTVILESYKKNIRKFLLQGKQNKNKTKKPRP